VRKISGGRWALLPIPVLLGTVLVGGVAVTMVGAGATPADAAILPPPEVVPLGPTSNTGGGAFMGGRIENLSLSPLNRQTMLAASEKGGLWKTTDGGGTWSHVNSLPVNQLGKVRYADKDLDLVVVTATADYGASKGGVWVSTDRGATWTRPASQDANRCASDAAYGADIMQLPQSTTELIQVGTACGIITSTDRGATFSFTDPSGKNDGQLIWDVHARPVAAGVQLDACGAHGFFRAIRGSAWSSEDAASPFEGAFACTVATAPDDANTVLGASFGGGIAACTTQLQESDDAWKATSNSKPTWTNLKPCADRNGRPPFVVTRPSFDANGGKINETFEVYFGDSTQILHQTCSYLTRPRCKVGKSDNATNWTLFDKNLPHGGADPTSLLWTPLFPGCPTFESGDGGIFRAQDCTGQPQWKDADTGITAQDVRAISGTASTKQDLYFATQDNGFYVSRDGGSTWQIKFGGDGFRVYGDATGPGSRVAFTTDCCFHDINENFDLNTDNFWTGQPPLPPGNGGGVGMAFNSWGNGNYAAITANAAGAFQLYQTTDRAQTWTTVGAALPAAPCQCQLNVGTTQQLQVSVPPGGARTFFMRLGSGLFRMTGNGAGATIRDLGAGPNNTRLLTNVTAFAVNPVDPTRAYAVDNGRMMRGSRTGAGANGAFTWTRDTNLENQVTQNGKFNLTNEVTAIAFDPTSTTVVVGTRDQGIKLSADGGTSWFHMRGSAVIPTIIGFYINPVNGAIYAGSAGRGVWQVKPTSRLNYLLGNLGLFPGQLRTITGGGLINLTGVTTGGATISSVQYRFYKQGGTPPAFKTVTGSKASFHLSGSNGRYVIEAFTKDNAGSQQIHQRELVDLDNPSGVCSGSGTLQGTFIFDLETCRQSTNTTGDLWWEQIDDVQRQLVPFSGGDQVAVLGQVDFSKVTFDQIVAAALGTTPVNGSNNSQNRLTPGTVLAARTRSGDFAKVRIDTYGYNLGLTVTTYRQPVPKTPPPPQLCANAGTLHGTFILDVEGCRESGDQTGDLWWEQVDSVQRKLVPWSAGDRIAVLGKVDFGALNLPDLLLAPYSTASIDGSNNVNNRLTPGTVLAVRTRNGHYAKVRVDSYGYDLNLTTVTYQ
jgi:hypothetical protein